MHRPSEESLLAAVAPALPTQRWFPVKGQPVTFRLLGRVPLPAPGPDHPDVTVVHLLVAVDAAGPQATFVESPVLQVPLTVRTQPLHGVPVLGRVDGLNVHDGPHDPAYVAALLGGFEAEAEAEADGPVHLHGHRLGRLPAPGCSSRVLSGEQSNTSVILDVDGPDPAMLKLFRVLAPGENPDVQVTAALTRAGSPDMPAVLGWLEAGWSGAPTAGDHRGHLAVLTRFVTGGRDAWAAAVDAAREGRSFAAEAARMGAATGRVHAALAQAFGSTECAPELLAATVAGLQHRVDWALAQAPALADLTAALLTHRERLAELTAADVGTLQRVHGDLHLGQVLLTGEQVAILDFEGEPLRPLAQRAVPDQPLRDVVGMLRSFDYAAAFGAGEVAGDAPAGGDPRTGAGEGEDGDSRGVWSRECADAFVDAWSPGFDRNSPMSRALWIDKALYEVVYETRNRPDWVAVPLAAVRTALDGA